MVCRGRLKFYPLFLVIEVSGLNSLLTVFSFPRLRLHDCKLIKERRYHLRTYPNCFVAQELTDWLVTHKEAPDRATAICLMQHLMDHDIVHHGKQEAPGWFPTQGYCHRKWPLGLADELKKCKHCNTIEMNRAMSIWRLIGIVSLIFSVCDKRPVFKDAKLLYRFRKDDGTFPFNKEVMVFMLGQRLYQQ